MKLSVTLSIIIISSLFCCSDKDSEVMDIHTNIEGIIGVDTNDNEKEHFKDSLVNNLKERVTKPGFTNPTPIFKDKTPGSEDISDDTDEVFEIDSLIFGVWSAIQIVDVYRTSDAITNSNTIFRENVSFILSIYEDFFSLEYNDTVAAIVMDGTWGYYGKTLVFVSNSGSSWSDTYIFGILSLSDTELILSYEHPYMIGDTIPTRESMITLNRQ